MKILVTGGAGFIGSAVVRHIIENTSDEVRVIDCLTYAGNLESLAPVAGNKRYSFSQTDITDAKSVAEQFSDFRPDIVMHLAAESHVDRSIDGPAAFIQTNLIGTFTLLEAARQYWSALDTAQKQTFRFHHISTDEVYGDLHGTDDLFTEETPYAPSSPYSASKAGSDHLVRAWNRTYGLPLPVYGNGEQIRDWLYVEDHARALYKVATEGRSGETYNIGGHNERKNIDVVRTICAILDKVVEQKPGNINQFADLITFVKDRPGHDLRYAIDAAKIQRDLGWVPEETFESGIEKTVHWYLNNTTWWQRVLDGSYAGERLGLNN